MGALLVAILILILLGLGGLAVHLLWYVLVIAFILWLVGFAFRPRGGRWYYW